MIRLRILVGVILLLPFSSFAEEKASASLKAFAEKIQGKHAYGVYIQGKKIGWSISEIKLTKHDGKDALLSTEETLFEIKRDQAGVKLHVTNTTLFGLEGDGEVLWVEEVQKEGKRDVKRRGERKDGRFVVTSSIEPKKERVIALPKKNLVMTKKLTDWLATGPKKGDTFEGFSISLEDANIDTPESYAYQARKTLLLSGVKTELHHVLVKAKGAVSDMDLLDDSTPVRATVGGFLEMRSEPEAQAKKVTPAEIDILALSSIRVDKELGQPEKITALTLEVQGLEDFKMPVCHRQQVKPGEEKGVVLLELKTDFKAEKAEPLSDAERKLMLAATPTVQSDDEQVKALAEKIIGEEKDIHKRADLIRRWVYRNLRKTYDANASTTLEVLKTKAGDCTEHALMFVSLARAVGIPAREVGGVGYYSNGQPLFGWHAWGEYHDGHQWVAVDPTWNQQRVDATHVKFSDSAEDMAWVNVLGKVKFKALKVEKK